MNKRKQRAKAERRLKRLQRRAERTKAELERRIEVQRAFTQTVPRPDNPGECCYKCGAVVEYRETKGKPKPGQAYGYRGYLWCPSCKTLYHCEKYKYWIDGAQLPARVPLARGFARAIESDRTESLAKRLQRLGAESEQLS